MTFKEDNEKERLDFVDLWSRYVLTHDDKDWSRQQNIIINSSLKAANMSRKEYLSMKSGKKD